MAIVELLSALYGDRSKEIYNEVLKLIGRWKSKAAQHADKGWVSENDVMMITYGDSIGGNNEAPLITLKRFADKYLKDTITALHILPMYPYTSDDGFSVIDYYSINEELGTWEDIKDLAVDYDMMYDAVVNHISKSSEWFKGFSKLIRLRRQQSAFSPDASQKVLFLDERAFSFIRHNNSTGEKILVIVNVSDSEYDIKYDCCRVDIVSQEEVSCGGIHMLPYQTRWIRY